MNNNRKAKKILKAFGKKVYKQRIEYVESFMPQKTSFIKSISYKHTLKRVGMVAVLVVLISSLAISAFAATVHYLNYTKVVHSNNDEYIPNGVGNSDKEVQIFEPTYIPPGFELESNDNNVLFNRGEWIYRGSNGERLLIIQDPSITSFRIDNENSESENIMVGDLEGVIYYFPDELLCMFQYENTVITIIGQIEKGEVEKIIKGMNITG